MGERSPTDGRGAFVAGFDGGFIEAFQIGEFLEGGIGDPPRVSGFDRSTRQEPAQARQEDVGAQHIQLAPGQRAVGRKAVAALGAARNHHPRHHGSEGDLLHPVPDGTAEVDGRVDPQSAAFAAFIGGRVGIGEQAFVVVDAAFAGHAHGLRGLTFVDGYGQLAREFDAGRNLPDRSGFESIRPGGEVPGQKLECATAIMTWIASMPRVPKLRIMPRRKKRGTGRRIEVKSKRSHSF